jgi:hypothetical protein
MGTVSRLPRPATPTTAEAIATYLNTLDHPENAGTRRVYASTLRQLRTHLGDDLPVGDLGNATTGAALGDWFGDQWGTRAPATFNRNLDAIRSAVDYWREQDWITTDPAQALRRRSQAPDHTRALARASSIAASTTVPLLPGEPHVRCERAVRRPRGQRSGPHRQLDADGGPGHLGRSRRHRVTVAPGADNAR